MRYVIGIKGIYLFLPNKELFVDSEASKGLDEHISPELLRIYANALSIAVHLDYTLQYMVFEGNNEKIIIQSLPNIKKSHNGLIALWVYQRVNVQELFPLLEGYFNKLNAIIENCKSLELEGTLNTMTQTILGFQSSALLMQIAEKTDDVKDIIEDFRKYLTVGNEFVSLGALDYLVYLNASYSDKKSQELNQIVLLIGIMCSDFLSNLLNVDLNEPNEIHLNFKTRDLFFQSIKNSQGWITVILRTGSHKLELLKMWIQANTQKLRKSISVPSATWDRQKQQFLKQLNALKNLLG